ncbi:MAG: hypothetical protein Kow0090_04590 [Myxococcota bacterium]
MKKYISLGWVGTLLIAFALACTSAKTHSDGNKETAGGSDGQAAAKATIQEKKELIDEAYNNLTPFERKIYTLLTGVEKTPAAKDFVPFDKKEAFQTLLKFSKDKSLKLFIRARAISSLVFFGGDEAEATIKETIANAEEPLPLRRTAIIALGETAGANAPQYLLPLLSDEDKYIREAVIISLQGNKDTKVVEALNARLSIETEEFLKEKITENLNLLAGEPKEKEIKTTK